MKQQNLDGPGIVPVKRSGEHRTLIPATAHQTLLKHSGGDQ